MQLAIFGINNDAVNLVVNLLLLFLVVVWLALIWWTYQDAKRRMDDPLLIVCSVAASLFPYIGTAVYAIVRPPEYLEDARERELEMRAAELRVHQLEEGLCPYCSYEVDRNFLRCPSCRRRLKDPCVSCGRPLNPRWRLCPYCEADVPAREPERRSRRSEGGGKRGAGSKGRGGAPPSAKESDRKPARSSSKPPPEKGQSSGATYPDSGQARRVRAQPDR